MLVTGWTFRKSGKLEVRREGAAAVYGIPYSEHSNFLELRNCVALLRPKRIIPTVNVTDAARYIAALMYGHPPNSGN